MSNNPENNNKEIKVLFIHSLFKTGSTYIWNKFRKNNEYFCFYEPLHPYLLSINFEYENEFQKDFILNNSNEEISPHYFKEYEGLINHNIRGLAYFKKEFIYDTYCETQSIDGLKEYIGSLIQSAGSKIPVLQFNRTAMRVDWFKRHFPEAFNIYLLRNPRDQFESYLNTYRHRSNIFLATDLLIASKNPHISTTLSRYIALTYYSDSSFDREIQFYSSICDAYSIEEHYIIFYYIWIESLIRNILNADLILDINQLSTNSRYRQRIEKILNGINMTGILFYDANINVYNNYTMGQTTLQIIESQIKDILIGKYNKIEMMIGKRETEYYKEYFSSANTDDSPEIKSKLIKKEYEPDKYNKISKILFDKYLNERDLKINKLQKAKKLNQNLSELRRELSLVYNSYTYRIGKIIIFPIRKIANIFRSFFSHTN